MFNFENVHEYYSKVSSHLDVDKINIPSFFVNAMNDKLSPYDTLDLDLCKYKLIQSKIIQILYFLLQKMEDMFVGLPDSFTQKE